MKEKVNDKVRITVYLTAKQHKSLKMIYAETGKRVTALIREAVDEKLKKK